MKREDAPPGCHMPVLGSIITDLNPSPGGGEGVPPLLPLQVPLLVLLLVLLPPGGGGSSTTQLLKYKVMRSRTHTHIQIEIQLLKVSKLD